MWEAIYTGPQEHVAFRMGSISDKRMRLILSDLEYGAQQQDEIMSAGRFDALWNVSFVRKGEAT